MFEGQHFAILAMFLKGVQGSLVTQHLNLFYSLLFITDFHDAFINLLGILRE